MTTVKVVEYVDIRAPRDEVYATVVNPERCAQLSPLWGVVQIEAVSAGYPAVGSGWRARLASAQPDLAPDGSVGHAVVVTDHVQGWRFGYRTAADGEPMTLWTFQDTAAGARIIYQEEFSVADGRGQEMAGQVRQVVRQWLRNIKRYVEFRMNRRGRLLRWLADRFYLKLRPDQRNLIATILALHAIGAIASVMAIIAFGFTMLF